jgi:hypothetical protein
MDPLPRLAGRSARPAMALKSLRSTALGPRGQEGLGGHAPRDLGAGHTKTLGRGERVSLDAVPVAESESDTAAGRVVPRRGETKAHGGQGRCWDGAEDAPTILRR